MRPEQLTAIANHATALRLQRPGLRPGQAHWNALELIDGRTARHLANTEADCFYDDTRIPAFWTALTKENA